MSVREIISSVCQFVTGDRIMFLYIYIYIYIYIYYYTLRKVKAAAILYFLLSWREKKTPEIQRRLTKINFYNFFFVKRKMIYVLARKNVVIGIRFCGHSSVLEAG